MFTPLSVLCRGHADGDDSRIWLHTDVLTSGFLHPSRQRGEASQLLEEHASGRYNEVRCGNTNMFSHDGFYSLVDSVTIRVLARVKHVHRYAHTEIHVCMCAHSHTHMHTRTHTHTHSCAHTHTHTHTHSLTHVHTHTGTRTHTHTHHYHLLLIIIIMILTLVCDDARQGIFTGYAAHTNK